LYGTSRSRGRYQIEHQLVNEEAVVASIENLQHIGVNKTYFVMSDRIT